MSDKTNDKSKIVTNGIVPFDLNYVQEDSENEDFTVSCKNPEFPTDASISIQHSQDVVIGNVTRFHGPVTIYQNTNNNVQEKHVTQNCKNEIMESKLVATETLVTKPVSRLIDNPQISVAKKWIVLGAVLLALIFLCISTILGLYIHGNLEKGPTDDIKVSGKHQFLNRSIWGGRPPLYTRKIHQPTKYVIIVHTASNFCDAVKSCSKIVAEIQNQHASQFLSPDVGYNFLVGGDENVYIARGWDAENFIMGDSISIAFIGNYIHDRLTPGMIEVTQTLLNEGLKEGKLDKDYKLISHNQTGTTLSPGNNVYNAIKFWPHYTSELAWIE